MAIIIEEEKTNSLSIAGILIWVVVVGILGAAIYYVFFTNPAIIETAIPGSFRNTQQLSQIILQPEEVSGNSVFRTLKAASTSFSQSPVGRQNPFLPLR